MEQNREREAFEAWLVSGYLVGGTFEQHYRLMDLVAKREVECAWKAWQARAALTPPRQRVTDSAKTEREALIAARPYVVGAYECAFPDDESNAEVLAMIDAALSAGEAQQGLTDAWIDEAFDSFCRHMSLVQVLYREDAQKFARAIVSKLAPARSEDQIIADFLDRTGQYVTNDATREKTISDALECAALTQPRQMIPDGSWYADQEKIAVTTEWLYGWKACRDYIAQCSEKFGISRPEIVLCAACKAAHPAGQHIHQSAQPLQMVADHVAEGGKMVVEPVAYVGWGGEDKPKTLLLKMDLPVGTSLYAAPVVQQEEADDEPQECPECHGVGRVEVTHEPLRDGYAETIRECCDTCQGTGKIATNHIDAAAGMVADSAGGAEPVHLDGRICEHCGEGNAVLTFEDGQFASNCDQCCADCDYFMVERLNQLIAAPAPVASPAALTAGSREKLIELANELDGELNSGANWTKAQHTCCSVSGELRALAAQPPAAAEAERDAARYRFIKASMLILSGGHRKFGWPVSPFGEQCDRYLDAAMSASKEGA